MKTNRESFFKRIREAIMEWPDKTDNDRKGIVRIFTLLFVFILTVGGSIMGVIEGIVWLFKNVDNMKLYTLYAIIGAAVVGFIAFIRWLFSD